MEKKSYENLKQRATREIILLLNNLEFLKIFIRFKKINFRCRSSA
jgi:hypothetical protein